MHVRPCSLPDARLWWQRVHALYPTIKMCVAACWLVQSFGQQRLQLCCYTSVLSFAAALEPQGDRPSAGVEKVGVTPSNSRSAFCLCSNGFLGHFRRRQAPRDLDRQAHSTPHVMLAQKVSMCMCCFLRFTMRHSGLAVCRFVFCCCSAESATRAPNLFSCKLQGRA